MIVWVIKGKTPSIQEAVDYIYDENKTAKKIDEARSEYESSSETKEEMTFEEYYLSVEDNINRAIKYISNKDKVEGYISGYLCDPACVNEEFKTTKQINLARVGKTLKDDKGNSFYHIIQSFPEGLEISDDEVHQCGVELVERLGLYQATIASHIHPTVDEEGEAHGKCKHNHIIINSHIYHEFVDPNNPYKMKYNNSDEAYAQLQHINDQIAIEHGLPIIINPDEEHTYSWHENDQKNKGLSWKQRVRIDINNAMKTCPNFDSYKETMEKTGYYFRTGHSKQFGEFITYTCPDGQKIRDYRLGQGYKKEELEAYWDIRKRVNEELLFNSNNAEKTIEDILQSVNEPLFIKVERKLSDKRIAVRKERNLNIKNTYTNYFPLNAPQKSYNKAELTYFEAIKTYEIVNSKHQVITEVSGADVISYYNRLYSIEQQKDEGKEKKEEKYYSRADYISSAVKSPYRVRLWDKNGRKRSTIELIIILALVTINKESGKWETKSVNPSMTQETKKHPIYARRDWKIQNMMDTIRIAREEKISDPTQLEKRLDAVGKETSKSKAEVRRLTAAKNRMDILYEAIESYSEVKEICEKIHSMPEGPEKTELQQKYAEEIEEYKKSKSVMYRFKATSDQEIADFRERYNQILAKLPEAEAQAEKNKEEYRRLSKLQYNIQLAQNKQYCYGPEYKDPELSPAPEPEKSEERNKE